VEETSYTVPGMSCGHCEHAIQQEVQQVAGVVSVVADHVTKLVVVRGDALVDAAIRAAIDEAGYEADAA
jgi:copper chaperone CopZ